MELTAARGGLAFSPRNNASFARSVHFARRPLVHACFPQSSFRYEDIQDVQNSGIRFEYNSLSSSFDAEVVELVITDRRYVDSSIKPCKTDAHGRELDGMEDAVITNTVHRKREW